MICDIFKQVKFYLEISNFDSFWKPRPCHQPTTSSRKHQASAETCMMSCLTNRHIIKCNSAGPLFVRDENKAEPSRGKSLGSPAMTANSSLTEIRAQPRWHSASLCRCVFYHPVSFCFPPLHRFRLSPPPLSSTCSSFTPASPLVPLQVQPWHHSENTA